MTAVLYVTELGNITIPTNTISTAISAALVQRVVVVPHVYAEDLPVGTNVKKFRKAGYLTAEAVTESNPYSSTNGEYTNVTPISLTAAKSAVGSMISVEAAQFSDVNVAFMAAQQGAALGRLLDDNVLALFNAFDNTVTATTILTAADVLKAVYTVEKSQAGRANGQRLVGIFDHKGIFELRKEIMQTGAAAMAQPSMISLLAGGQSAQGYVGFLPGVDLYETDGTPTGSSDNYQLVFNPDMCFCGIYSPTVQVQVMQQTLAGFYTEIGSFIFSAVAEWNDNAGCTVRSDS